MKNYHWIVTNETNTAKTLVPILEIVGFELCKIDKSADEYGLILLSSDQCLMHVPTEFQFMNERVILKSQSDKVRRRIIFH